MPRTQNYGQTQQVLAHKHNQPAQLNGCRPNKGHQQFRCYQPILRGEPRCGSREQVDIIPERAPDAEQNGTIGEYKGGQDGTHHELSEARVRECDLVGNRGDLG